MDIVCGDTITCLATRDEIPVQHCGLIHSLATGNHNTVCMGGRYNGEQIHEEKFDVLLEASWQPAPAGSFQELPEPSRSNGASGGRAANPAETRPAAFRVPHLRGSSGAVIAQQDESTLQWIAQM